MENKKYKNSQFFDTHNPKNEISQKLNSQQTFKKYMRAIWTGSLGFGLVNIPIKMFSAVQDSTLDLDMLDSKDHSNIKFKRVNEKTGREVPWENIVRGYYLDDRYVVLDKSDFEKAGPEKTKHIEIKHFVDETEIDSMYF